MENKKSDLEELILSAVSETTTINSSDLGSDTITINSSDFDFSIPNLYDYSSNTTIGNLTIGSGSGGALGSSWTTPGYNGTVYTTNNTGGWLGPSNPGLKVNGDAEFDGKVKINGQDIAEFMETISKRLAILVPDPEKLEHFTALKKAYEHYKTLEALCEIPKKEDKE